MFENNRKNLVYLLILLVPFFIFFVRSQSFSSFKFSIANSLATPIRIVTFPFREAKKILYYHRTFDEYRRLKKETDVLKTRLIGMDEVILENKRLEDLLEFKRKLIYSSVAANVIGRDPSFWNSTMIIDRGEEEGIKPGMPVVNAFGVVGKIAEVSARSSKVILLTDPRFSVAALVKRPRESGLISGTLQGACRLHFLNSDADIRVGDQIITSKLSSSFPDSLMVGKIVSIRKDANQSSLEGIVEPAVSLSQIEEVLVILNE